jgi:hypothetical protein
MREKVAMKRSWMTARRKRLPCHRLLRSSRKMVWVKVIKRFRLILDIPQTDFGRG